MSRVYFHSPEETAEIKGSARAHLRHLCDRIAIGMFEIPDEKKQLDLLLLAFPENHYMRRTENISELIQPFLRLSDEKLFGKIDIFSMLLNTAWLVGNDDIKLAAKIHGQCEIHCWVKGENRLWLSNIMANFGTYYSQIDWSNAINLLRADNTDPVVLSYSVCESFPNPGVAEWSGSYDEWESLESEAQWQMAIDGLQKSGRGLEISPDNWDDFYFGQGWDFFKFGQLLDIGANSDTPLETVQEVISFYESLQVRAKVAWEQTVSRFTNQAIAE